MSSEWYLLILTFVPLNVDELFSRMRRDHVNVTRTFLDDYLIR